MSLTPLPPARSTLASAAYEALLDALASGGLRPGDRLVMDKLASELGISRTPVRDALQRLEQEGTIVAAERRGYVVRSMTAREVEELYQAREAVEGYAARLVAAIGEPAVRHVEEALELAAAEDRGDLRSSYLANRSLHRSVVEATGNGVLIAMFDDIWGKSAALLTYVELFDHEVEHHDVGDDHLPLLDALRSGDSSKAEAVLIAHIREGLGRNLEVLEC
jgi:DNA-binding GntR family transcriptional regulator